MEAWYSGLMPYPCLLPSQLVLIALMAKICADFTRGRGFFYAMVARAVLLWDRPIPIVFHWVLAAFVITVGHSHRRRLA